MLGFRGCRLAIAYPEIAEMQARAIFEAAVEASRQTGKTVAPEIMVPLIASKIELDIVKERIDATAKTVAAETKRKLKYQVGTMIELPRAALKADEIAETAEFFSFGTNDLTQTAFGISRDDAASFLGIYTAKGILPSDPFVSLDRDGVGELIRIACRTRPQSARRSSSSAFAASTAAIRPRWRSVTRSSSTTCRARRSACRSRASPRRKPRSARARLWMDSITSLFIARSAILVNELSTRSHGAAEQRVGRARPATIIAA